MSELDYNNKQFKLKITIGYFLGFAVLSSLVYAICIFDRSSSISIRITVASLGGLVGWIAGIIVTPASSEKSQFKNISKTISVFLSGFILAKIDRLWDQGATKSGFLTEVLVANLLFFGAFFSLGFILVFIGRKYL